PSGIREVRDHLKRLTREKGMAVIVSSHLLSEMEMMCDRFAIIQEGKLVDIQFVHEKPREMQKYVFILEGELNKLPADLDYKLINGGIEMELNRKDVPAVVKLLVENDMHIY